MKALRKGVLYAVALVAILGMLALLAGNLFLRSPGIRQHLEERLEKHFQSEVTFGAISYLPWRGVKVGHLEVAQREDIQAYADGPFLHVETLLADLSLWSLVDRPIQLGRIRAVNPTLEVLQWVDGSLVVPWFKLSAPAEVVLDVQDPSSNNVTGSEVAAASEGEPKGAEDLVASGDSEPTPTPATPAPEGAASAASEVTEEPLAWRLSAFLVDSLTIKGGRASILGPRGERRLLELEGGEAELDLAWLGSKAGAAGAKTLGSIRVAQAWALGVLETNGLHSPLQIRNDGAVALPEIKAVSDGGTVNGAVIVDPRRSGMPFQLNLRCEAVGIPTISQRAPVRMAFSRGTLEAEFALEGFLQRTRSWRGAGRLEAQDAALARNALLESFGRYVGLREFVELAFEESRAQFRVQGPVVWFDDIHWKTENVEFKGLGAVGLNREVKLAARLYFSRRVQDILQRIERQLPEHVLQPSHQLEGRDDYYRDFGISGPLRDLKADFIGGKDRSLDEMLELLKKVSEEGEGAASG